MNFYPKITNATVVTESKKTPKELIREQVKKSESLVSIEIQTHKQPVIITSYYRPTDSDLLVTYQHYVMKSKT